MAKSRAKASSSDADPADHPLTRLHVWQVQAIRDILVFAAAAGLLWAGYALRAVTVPLLVALLLAYLFEPLVARLTRRNRMSRSAAAGGLIAAGVVVVALTLALVIPVLVHQTATLIEDLQTSSVRDRVVELGRHVPERYRADYVDAMSYVFPGPRSEEELRELLPDEEDADANGAAVEGAPPAPAADDETPRLTRADIEAIVDERLAATRPGSTGEVDGGGMGRWVTLSRGGLQALWTVLGAVLEVSLLSFLIPFYFFFFVVWYPDVQSFAHKLIPSKNRRRWLALLGKMDDVVAGFVRGRIIISAIMGVMLWIGWLACGVPYALPLGIVVGVFCAVPYLGGIGIPLAIGLLAYDQLGQSPDARMAWWLVLILPTAVFVIVQLVEGYVLTPTIAGKATNLDPVTILVVVLAGGSVAGIYGMLLAIPVAACGKIMITEIVFPKIQAWTRGEARDPLPIDR